MDPERYLADAFDELTSAGRRDTSVQIVVRAAHELADVDGVCMLSAAGERCVVALAQQQEIHLCDLRNSGLYRAAAPLLRGETTGSRTLWGKEDFIALATGEQLRVGVALIVPLQAASGHLAVAFFWQPGRTTGVQGTRTLELLAKALGLAASAWRKDEEYAANERNQHRISADLKHRLRNNLAQTRSIIRRSQETAESAEQFALHLEARIGAVGRIQGALTSAGDAGVELEDLVRTELIASAVPERSYSMQGPAVRLHTKGADSLALAVHELATNSLKFGSLATPNGHLAVIWEITDGQLPRLRITWIESGTPIASLAPRRRGFGLELIECTLPYELGAQTRLMFSPGGVVCEIDVPLEACATEIKPRPPRAAYGGAR
jgi:two-component sensor histidine kinase